MNVYEYEYNIIIIIYLEYTIMCITKQMHQQNKWNN